ncbi:putative ArsR family transcriptional regulator [Streptomyces achromogenes]|nr:putative ArsR family transcriptional regulator [Streptomyces achromogenes]
MPNDGVHGILGCMDFHNTVRECARRLLNTADRPLTIAHIADRIDTTPLQAGRALRQLEAEGAATRTRGQRPAYWTATRP